MVLFLSLNIIRYRIDHGKRAGKRSITALPIKPAREHICLIHKTRAIGFDFGSQFSYG